MFEQSICIGSDGYFFQEFYIKHADGIPISSEAERQRVIQCLQAAVERRASKVTTSNLLDSQKIV